MVAGGKAAQGIIAKAVEDLFRAVAKDGAKDAARGAEHDVARQLEKDLAKALEKDINKDVDDDLTRALEERITCADPVDIATGEVVLRQEDVTLPGLLPLVLARTHISSYRDGRCFGASWAGTLDQRVSASGGGLRLLGEDGVRLEYPLPRGGEVLPERGARWPLRATVRGGYAVTDPVRGWTFHFDRYGVDYPLVAITERNGHRLDVDRDPDGSPVAVRHSGGYHVELSSVAGRVVAYTLRTPEGPVPLVRFGYDEAGLLASVIDSSGVPQRFWYDDGGRLTGWADRNDRWYRYSYDAEGRCVRTEGVGGVLNAAFSYAGRVTTVTDSLGNQTVYELDRSGRVVLLRDPLGAATASVWDGSRPVAHTDPLGRTTRYGYDEAGNLTSVVRPGGGRLTASYAGPGLPVRIVGPDGATWQRAYDSRGNLVAVTDPAGAVTRYTYAAGRLTSVVDALGNVRAVRCDAAGLQVAVTDPLGATTTYQRDAFGRVTALTDPLGGTVRFGWTPEGHLAWRALADGSTERWGYDGEGNQVAHVDAVGVLRRTEYGAFELPSAFDGPEGRHVLSYDTELHLTAVTNPAGLRWTYEYDAAGRLSREVDYNGLATDYRYDLAGQLSSRTVAGAAPRSYVRDQAGRVLERRTGALLHTFGYDHAGRLVRAATGSVVLTYTRDPAGRVLAETRDGHTTKYEYDLLGRRIRRVTPSGAESRWEYDPRWQPTALHAGAHSIRFGYDRAGREVARALPGDLLQTRRYHPTHRVAALAVTAGPTALVNRGYDYRPDGYLTALTDPTDPVRYTLDPAGRVEVLHTPTTTEHYTYAPDNTLRTATTTAGTPTPPEPSWPRTPVAGQLPSAGEPSRAGDPPWAGERSYAGTLVSRAGRTTYRHDDRGRLLTRTRHTLSGQVRSWTYDWDDEDRLVAVTTPDGQRWVYGYDALGRRVTKQLAGDAAAAHEYHWDGVVLAEQTTPASVTTWDCEPDTYRPLAQRDRATPPAAGPHDPTPPETERFHSIVCDLIGAPTELLTPQGTVAWRAATTMWGAASGGPRSAVARCPLRFPGQYHDDESGLHYNYHRYYDPETARYLSPDPIGLAGGPDPHGYVPNPTEWADPLGLAICSLRQLKMDLGRAGMSVRDYDIVHVPEITDLTGRGIFGRSGALGDGSPLLGPRGRPLIEITDLGLANRGEAVKTIFHEMFHIRSNTVRGWPGSEAEAEQFGQRMLDLFLQRGG